VAGPPAQPVAAAVAARTVRASSTAPALLINARYDVLAGNQVDRLRPAAQRRQPRVRSAVDPPRGGEPGVAQQALPVPQAGLLRLRSTSLAVADMPEARIVVDTPSDDETRERLPLTRRQAAPGQAWTAVASRRTVH
jgi:hypothetical protein